MLDLTWPTVEAAVVATLKPILTTYTEAPSDLASVVPCVVVQQTPGGGQTGEIELNPRVDVDLVASKRKELTSLAPRVLAALVGLSCSAAAGIYFDDVRVVEDFGFLPYKDLNLRRMNALVEFTVRPQRA